MVLEAILTGKQPHEKLYVKLYVSGNLMSNIFRKTAVLPKKTGIVNSSFTTKFCTSKLWGPQRKKRSYTQICRKFENEVLAQLILSIKSFCL